VRGPGRRRASASGGLEGANYDEIRYEGYGEFHLNDGTYALWDRRIRELLEE